MPSQGCTPGLPGRSSARRRATAGDGARGDSQAQLPQLSVLPRGFASPESPVPRLPWELTPCPATGFGGPGDRERPGHCACMDPGAWKLFPEAPGRRLHPRAVPPRPGHAASGCSPGQEGALSAHSAQKFPKPDALSGSNWWSKVQVEAGEKPLRGSWARRALGQGLQSPLPAPP